MDARVTPQCCSDADKIRKFVADSAGIEVTEATNETHLANDLGLDWLDQIELLVMIEDEFVGVDFFAITTAQIELVGDIIRHIEGRGTAPTGQSVA